MTLNTTLTSDPFQGFLVDNRYIDRRKLLIYSGDDTAFNSQSLSFFSLLPLEKNSHILPTRANEDPRLWLWPPWRDFPPFPLTFSHSCSYRPSIENSLPKTSVCLIFSIIEGSAHLPDPWSFPPTCVKLFHSLPILVLTTIWNYALINWCVISGLFSLSANLQRGRNFASFPGTL